MTTESPRWYTSSYSNNGGQCVEVAPLHDGALPVRDSKAPTGPVLLIPATAWTAFATAVRDGQL